MAGKRVDYDRPNETANLVVEVDLVYLQVRAVVSGAVTPTTLEVTVLPRSGNTPGTAKT